MTTRSARTYFGGGLACLLGLLILLTVAGRPAHARPGKAPKKAPAKKAPAKKAPAKKAPAKKAPAKKASAKKAPAKAATDAEKAADKVAKAVEKVADKAAKAVDKAAAALAKSVEKFEQNIEKYEEQFEKLQEQVAKANSKGQHEKQQKLEEKIAELQRELAKQGRINPTSVPIVTADMFTVAAADSMRIGATLTHDRATGRGIVVAVLDSGFNLAHPAIANRLLPFSYDAVGYDLDAEDLGNGFDDDYDGQTDKGVGHGTFVAGMVLSAAPDALILPVRVADDEGYGTEAEIARGIQFAIDMGVHVINLSLEAGSKTRAIKSMLEDARRSGIIIVASAGNDAEDKLGMLAEQRDVLAVGAVDDEGREASFSNSAGRRQEPTIYALGVDLIGPYGSPTDDAMCMWSGTSFAAGIAAGAVAVALELFPYLASTEVVDRLREAVDPVRDESGKWIKKTGSINLEKLLD